MHHCFVSRRDNGESRRQQPATSSGDRFSVLEAVCRLWGQNRRPFPPLHHGELLAQPVPQVLLLPGPTRWNRHVVLHKKWYDSLQKWLYQVRWKDKCVLAVIDMYNFSNAVYESRIKSRKIFFFLRHHERDRSNIISALWTSLNWSFIVLRHVDHLFLDKASFLFATRAKWRTQMSSVTWWFQIGLGTLLIVLIRTLNWLF